MPTLATKADDFYVALARLTIRFRWLSILASLAVVALFAGAIGELRFSAHFKSYFSKANPELVAYNELVDEYVEPINISIVVHPLEGDIYNPQTLKAIAEITKAAWQLPYVNRVDSLANYQYTSVDEDDLVVAALIENADRLDDERVRQIRSIATSEPLIHNRLVSKDGRAAIVVANNALPGEAFSEIREANLAARAQVEKFRARYPELKIVLGGYTVTNYVTFEAAVYDMQRLIPAMFVLMLVLAWVGLRSMSMTFGLVVIIASASLVSLGVAGWSGFQIDSITGLAPVIVMTLAVADSIHILLSTRDGLSIGQDKNEALVEAVRVNFAPVAITSLTTSMGFLTITAADAPPLHYLGYMTAAGVMAAWFFSIFLLPAIVSLLPVSALASRKGPVDRGMDFAAKLVIAHRGKVLLLSVAVVAGLMAFIPRLELNDEFSKWTSTRLQVRRDLDFTQQFFAVDSLEYSLPAGDAEGINDPEYLQHVDEFATWLREQEEIESVYAISDVVKRLNRNLNADDPAFYRVPETADAAAQYLLLYELSLPYGLDLNDRFNIDKSASRLSAVARIPGTREGRELVARIDDWIQTNLPSEMQTEATGIYVLFALISQRNMESMIGSTGLLVLAIGAVMALGLRSVWLGALSLLPTCLPIAVATGIWAILVGQVGFTLSIVAAVALGIIIDNAVHLMSKFVRAQRTRGLNAEESLHYTFNHVGVAIFYNSVILAAGFALLMTSAYRANVELGALTTITIVTAFFLDMLMLPAMLMIMSEKAPRVMGKILGQPGGA